MTDTKATTVAPSRLPTLAVMRSRLEAPLAHPVSRTNLAAAVAA